MSHYQHHSLCLAGHHSITERNKLASALLLHLLAFPVLKTIAIRASQRLLHTQFILRMQLDLVLRQHERELIHVHQSV